jgi:hypothetical protein
MEQPRNFLSWLDKKKEHGRWKSFWAMLDRLGDILIQHIYGNFHVGGLRDSA